MKHGCYIAALALSVSGCLGPNYNRYQSVGATELRDHGLQGPYTRVELVAPTTYLVRDVESEQEVEVSLRGVVSTGAKAFDQQFFTDWDRVLRREDIYLVEDTMTTNEEGRISAVLVLPRVSFASHDLETGGSFKTASSYEIMQQISLSTGEVLLDRSDTNYWLYPVFEHFEQEARKRGAGFWGSTNITDSIRESDK